MQNVNTRIMEIVQCARIFRANYCNYCLKVGSQRIANFQMKFYVILPYKCQIC